MSEVEQVGELQIDENVSFERRFWRFQHAGWVVMLLVVIAALLGLLGGAGILSADVLEDNEGVIQLHYLRFLQQTQGMNLRLHVNPPDPAAELVAIFITQDYLDNMNIQAITPQPESVRAASDRLIFVFALQSPGESAAIDFHLTPSTYGAMSGAIGVEGGAGIDFTQFIYP